MTLSVCAKAPMVLALTLVAIVSSAAAGADRAPDIKGKWAGKTYTIVAGSGGHWPKVAERRPAKAYYRER